MDFKTLQKIVTKNNSFLLTTHVNPDADAIGSEIALYRILKRLRKEVFIINHSSTPYNLAFLDEEKIILKYDAKLHNKYFENVDVLVALDLNRSNRLVSMEKAFLKSKKIKICIDHHQEPEDFADYHILDDQYSATSQILYNFVKETKIVKMDYEIAYPLYAGIMTDTGSFRFERTTAKLHNTIAELLNTGVDPVEIYDKIYDQSKISKIRLLGRALDTLKLIENDKIGYMFITQDTFDELNAFESDTENFVNYTLSIENVVLGLLFIELKKGFKVSFRSKGNLPVNKLAAKFGGGGHTNAAGARFYDANMIEEIEHILDTTKEFFKNYKQEENV